MQENLQTIIASFYRYWGAEVAEMLTKVGDIDKQRRVVNAFMRIIQLEHWREKDYAVEITEELEKDIEHPVSLFVKLCYLDKLAVDVLRECQSFFPLNKE